MKYNEIFKILKNFELTEAFQKFNSVNQNSKNTGIGEFDGEKEYASSSRMESVIFGVYAQQLVTDFHEEVLQYFLYLLPYFSGEVTSEV